MKIIRTRLSTDVEERVQEMWIPAGVPVKIPWFGDGDSEGSSGRGLEETITFHPTLTAEEARRMEEFQNNFESSYLVRHKKQTINLEPCLLFVTHNHTVINFGNPTEGSEVYVPEIVLDHRHRLQDSGVEDLIRNFNEDVTEPVHPRMVWNPDEHCVYVVGGVGGPKTSPVRHYHSTLERFGVGPLDGGDSNRSSLSCFPGDLRWTKLLPRFESTENVGLQKSGGLTHFGTVAACMYKQHLLVLGGFRKQRSVSGSSRHRRSDHVSAFRPGGEFVWRSLAPMPMALSCSSAVSFQGSLFVVGGVNNTGCAVQSVFKLEGLMCGFWTCVSALLQPRKLAAVFSDTSNLFVFGGYGGCSGDWLASAEMYDPELDTWTPLPPMPQPLLFPYAFEVFGDVFVVGKNVGAPVFKFCRQSKTWEQKPLSLFGYEAAPSFSVGDNAEVGLRGQFVLVGQQPPCSFGEGQKDEEGTNG